ncbi:MAG TPA: alpha-mannosidase [Candidatus Alistipes avistercoris]|nr:alpha-mannosidase [Candidatus Alistipes avistercoris]
MNKTLLAIALFGLAAGETSAQQIGRVARVEPVRYEKRDGRLKILSYVKLSETPARKAVLQLGDEPLAVEAGSTGDSLLVWLPMIGKSDVLTLRSGRKVLSSKAVEAPIPDDWGYFRNGTIHIIQSSHQDIAWMDTPEYCRTERIEDIIIPALDIMREDPNFTFEMEQTLNLMEFLEAHPERRDEVIERYKEGRFVWGATYNQPYEGLASGEQLVRQAYYGRKWIRENLPGCDDRTANNVDVPGRTMQMPQILAKSGIRNLFVSRMREGLYDWYSPDGSSVLTYTPGNYGWATLMWKFFEKDAVTAFERLHPRSRLWSDYFRSRHIPPHYAVLMSCDATKPVNFAPVIDEWNRIVELAEVELPRLKCSTAEEYLALVDTPEAQMEEVVGERPDLWLYIHGPAHYQQTVAKREAGVLLPAAELFTAVNNVCLDGSWDYPRAAFDRAWMASIYPDHGLGGKNGEITDRIFGDSLSVARDLGRSLLDASLRKIADRVPEQAGNWVVFNDLQWDRTEVAYLPAGDRPAVVCTSDGRELPVQRVERDGRECLAFVAEGVPSFGYAAYRVKPVAKEPRPVVPAGVEQGDNYYRNAFYDIVLGDGGIVSLYDFEQGCNLAETSRFAFGDILDAGYKGNGAGEFNRIADLEVDDQTLVSAQPASWRIVATGAVCTTFENAVQTAFARVIQRITVYHAIKKIDFDVTLENFTGEHNRQYRILFPLNMKRASSRIHYEVPMGVAEVGVSEMKSIPGGWSWGGTYVHHPADSHPREIQNFISASGNGFGVTMSSCVAVADWIDPSRDQSDYPVLQGILLSSHKSCHGEGNWYHQTGTHSFRFSILGHEAGWQNGYCFGVGANHPLLPVAREGRGGDLEASCSFIRISDPLVSLTTLKKADGGNALILRLTEMEGVDKMVEVTLPFDVKRVTRTDLIEEGGEPVAGSGRRLTLRLGHHAIETYKLEL